MYIKSIVLDGFKSYGNRVEITGFDPEFNAVTGLNGTGKSNILDSICFVLGITNLSNVRAGSLQELIYKHGQAGITKATVSITFDNSDKRQCPIGYEGHDEITVTRQVVMGGKNKYLINGLNVQNKRVSDLFCGVQLNVNNPHFLIMQGRITKVLNMKPPEILAMVEEAAGTRMYEAKKQAAQKTIEKKDAKLRELNDIIKEDIAPKLQKLQDERSQFQEYQKVVRELENLTRLYVAWKYVSAQESTTEAESKVTQVRDDIQKKHDSIEENKKAAKLIDVHVAELNKKLDEESGNILKQLETELATLEKTEATTAANQKALKEAAASSDKRTRLLEKTLKDDEQALAAKNKVLSEVSTTFEKLRAASDSSAAALTEAQKHFLAVSAGKEDAADTLQDQLMAAKAEASEASTQITQSTMERKHCQQRADKLEKEFTSSSQHFQQDQQRIQHSEQQLHTIQNELSKINFNEEQNETLKVRARSLQGAVRRARDQAERLGSRLQRCDVHYSDPSPGFDRRRVPGTVCKLITPVDPVYCTALETAAGGKLYNLIVDTEVTSKAILERGNLQTRTTIIPLNKISGRPIDARTVRLAQDIGGGPENVQLALDLVTFEDKLRPAMSWVFGQTLVCRDLDTARKVTFHPQVRRRCVTLEGDVFDPSGTLSGGARATGGSILVELQKLKESESEMNSLVAELSECESLLQANTHAADQYAALKNKYDITAHELELMKQRVASTSHAQLHEEIQTLKQKVQHHDQLIQESKQRLKVANARAQEMEAKVNDIKGHREREFKKAEEALKKAKKAAEEHSASWKKREQEFETLRLEVQELEKAVTSSREQLEGTKSSCGELKEQLEIAAQEYNEANSAVKEMQSRIKKHKASIAGRSSEISSLHQKKEQLLKTNNELQLKITELEYQVKELHTEAIECVERIKSLEREHSWILEEKQYFGLAGGMYDWSARPGSVTAARLNQLKERRDKLARGLNARAHTLLGKEEEQYQDVMRKKKIVEADRAKLVQVMSELDEKKKRTLVAACEQVNKDFGSIFSSLLPGAQASLTPPQGLTVLDGLEVRVGFNNTWKESLGELSGGQRSLVALALVLAMLLFKPAPLYILDEVDAALDLSHTQNISAMLKDHFRHSQFIVVSLKDGMFNNANVLFRTKFVDGMSTVQRTVNNRR